MRKSLLGLTLGAAILGSVVGGGWVNASDHDDGTTDMKTKNTNLTDLYVFRESDQDATANATDLIFIMNLNDRSLPQQNYFFNTSARYEFHVTRVADNDNVPTGNDDLLLRFEFDAPDDNNQQKMTITAVNKNTNTTFTSTEVNGGGNIMTTPLGAAEINNSVPLGGQDLTVFAGLREDPFFFDVEQFFLLRADFANGPPNNTTFRDDANAVDFTDGYNVLSIVVRVPRSFLQQGNAETSFDVWETISIPQ